MSNTHKMSQQDIIINYMYIRYPQKVQACKHAHTGNLATLSQTLFTATSMTAHNHISTHTRTHTCTHTHTHTHMHTHTHAHTHARTHTHTHKHTHTNTDTHTHTHKHTHTNTGTQIQTHTPEMSSGLKTL